jgi:hypothetical protein
MSTGGYPLGAQYDSNAPYNETENPEIEVTVCVSVTYHKSFQIKVKDYEIIDEYADEDGEYRCERDFTNCNLYKAVEDQIGECIPDETWTQDEKEIILD